MKARAGTPLRPRRLRHRTAPGGTRGGPELSRRVSTWTRTRDRLDNNHCGRVLGSRMSRARVALRDRDQEQAEVSGAAGEVVDPLAGGSTLDQLPGLVDDQDGAAGKGTG